jgi:hypothetical protein
LIGTPPASRREQAAGVVQTDHRQSARSDVDLERVRDQPWPQCDTRVVAEDQVVIRVVVAEERPLVLLHQVVTLRRRSCGLSQDALDVSPDDVSSRSGRTEDEMARPLQRQTSPASAANAL